MKNASKNYGADIEKSFQKYVLSTYTAEMIKYKKIGISEWDKKQKHKITKILEVADIINKR